jgi:Zn-finger nucleic acid-binding protein
MGSPYRERPRFLLCPRCGEALDRVFEGVSSCLRCEGLWIAPATLDAAFGDPRWPGGNALWWRNSLECPECAFEGKATLMVARLSSDVLVDQCAEHGVWLDRGELGRLMGGAADELAALRDRLAVAAPELDQLVARRETWRADVDVRRKAAHGYRQAQEEEHRRRLEIAGAERARLAAEARDRPAPAAVRADRPVARGPAVLAGPPPAGPDPLDAARQAAKRRHELAAQRAHASAEVARLEGNAVAAQDYHRRVQDMLADAQARATELRRELDQARAKLRSIDDQLDEQA